MGRHMCHACKFKGQLAEAALSFYLFMRSGVVPRLPGFCGKSLYLLCQFQLSRKEFYRVKIKQHTFRQVCDTVLRTRKYKQPPPVRHCAKASRLQ
jgi:hypothetical protein